MSQNVPREFISIIENLNEGQLHIAYNLIAERLNLVHKASALYAMRNFHIMDRVSFHHNGKHYEGLVTRLNQKTITVTLDDGSRWGISPGNLTKLNQENPLKEILTKEQWQKMQKENKYKQIY